jgi:peptide/nickel transport system substrate-binding protein
VTPSTIRLGTAAAAAVAALALAGCSSGTSDGGSDAGGETGGAAQRLHYAYAFTPVAELSPYSDDAVTSYGAGATETLARLDPAGTPEPSLATSWTQVDPTTWRFELQPGVAFQDGTAMDAAAVAASLTHATQAEPLPRALTGTELSVTADGTDAVVVTTAEPDPVLVQRLTSPELAILSAGAYADDPNAPDPVGTGTGPFTITELDGTSAMHLDANADYWGGTPELAGVDVDFVADGESRASALRSGTEQLAQALPASLLGQLDDDQVLAVPLPRTVSVHLTQSSPVFSDPGLREAAREAIAGVDLAGTIYDGHADAAQGLFAPSVSSWAADRPAPAYPTATEPSGQEITLATFSDRPEMSEIATALADALREAGFEVSVVVQEYNQLEDKFLDGTFDAVIMSRSYGQDTADPVSYLQTDFGCEGTYNLSRWCAKDTDEELAQAARLTDVAARDAAAVQVESELLSQVAVVPLVHDRTQFGVTPGLSGLAEDPWERAVVTADTTLG